MNAIEQLRANSAATEERIENKDYTEDKDLQKLVKNVADRVFEKLIKMWRAKIEDHRNPITQKCSLEIRSIGLYAGGLYDVIHYCVQREGTISARSINKETDRGYFYLKSDVDHIKKFELQSVVAQKITIAANTLLCSGMLDKICSFRDENKEDWEGYWLKWEIKILTNNEKEKDKTIKFLDCEVTLDNPAVEATIWLEKA